MIIIGVKMNYLFKRVKKEVNECYKSWPLMSNTIEYKKAPNVVDEHN